MNKVQTNFYEIIVDINYNARYDEYVIVLPKQLIQHFALRPHDQLKMSIEANNEIVYLEKL